MENRIRILILEDNPFDAELMQRELRKAGLAFDSNIIDTEEAFLRELENYKPDVVLSDYVLASFDGLAALRIRQDKRPEVPFILVSGAIGEETAIEALKRGATDFVLKYNLSRLSGALERALAETESSKRRKEAEEQRAIFNFLVESAIDGIAMADVNGRLIYANRSCHELFGYDHESAEAIGRSISSFWFEEDAPLIERISMAVMNGGWRGEVRHRRKDGNLFDSYLSIFPLIDESGHVAKIGAVIRDISAIKKTEEQLRYNEARFRRFLENLGDFAYEVDASGTVVYANRMSETITGFTKEDIINTPFGRLFSPEERGKAEEAVKSTLEESKRDFELVFANNKIYHLNNVVVKDLDGNITGFIGTARDVTERARYEEALRSLNQYLEERIRERTDELSVANEELRQFAYTISHDLRAPLLNLKGFAEELRSGLAVLEDSCKKRSDFISIPAHKDIVQVLQRDIPEALYYIEDSVTRMEKMLEAVLNLSRLGHRELQFERISMNELVERILKTMAHKITSCGASVELAELPDVVADATSVEMIVGNLIDNALKYLSPDRRGKIAITGDEGPQHMVFRIRDNGRGISEQNIPKIFGLFKRVDSSNVPGAGMGLAYTQAAVRHLGGNIWCESELGSGSVFSFTIPNEVNSGG